MVIRAKQGRLSEGKDYDTGYRKHFYEIEVDDRLPHEPSTVRFAAQEHGTNRWTLSGFRGPHEEKDERGSYYRDVGESETLEGPAGKINAELKTRTKGEYRRLMEERGK